MNARDAAGIVQFCLSNTRYWSWVHACACPHILKTDDLMNLSRPMYGSFRQSLWNGAIR